MQPTKEITLGHEGRTKVLAGITKAAKAVAPTLGAVGMTGMIDWEGLDPITSDDGKTILAHLEFADKYENMGLKMLRKAANRTSEEGGDGTATTTVLTAAITEEAMKELAADAGNAQTIRERLDNGLKETLELMATYRRNVEENDVERIATISSLDPEVAKLIAGVIGEVGVNGVVTVEKGSKIGYTSEVVKGARFQSGLISHYFMNDIERERTELKDAYIFLVDRKLSLNEQISNLMSSIMKTGNKTILIVADDVDGLALASLSQASRMVQTVTQQGTMQGTWDIACVKNPYNASRGKDFLADLAALTGATVISEEAGMKLNEADIGSCGFAEKVIVTRDTCTIIGGKPKSPEALQSRIKSVEKQIDETTSEYQKLMLEERLACLTGGIGVIRVGTYTDTDFNEKKLKFDNAINATQAALQEGILPGGGVTLRSIAHKIEDNIFRNALSAPFEQMCINANYINEGTDSKINESNTMGWDFKNRKEVDMFDAGIIDPFKVTRLALESAVHIATKVVTAHTFIVKEKDEKK